MVPQLQTMVYLARLRLQADDDGYYENSVWEYAEAHTTQVGAVHGAAQLLREHAPLSHALMQEKDDAKLIQEWNECHILECTVEELVLVHDLEEGYRTPTVGERKE